MTQEADMIRSLYKISSKWNALEPWLEWAKSNKLLFRIFDKNEFAGLAVVRPVNDLSKIADFCYMEQNGDTLWADIACSKIYGGTKVLWKMVAKKFKNFKYVAFMRNGEKIKKYNFDRFAELMKVGA
jgi:hypothetical protein